MSIIFIHIYDLKMVILFSIVGYGIVAIDIRLGTWGHRDIDFCKLF